MENLVSYLTITVLVVTTFWPLTIPLVALAYKVRYGPKPIPLETREFWVRSTAAALGLAVMAVLMAGLNYLGIGVVQFPDMPVQLAVLMIYFPAGTMFLFWIFAMDEWTEGLGTLVVTIFLPGLPLLVSNWILDGWLEPYRVVKDWF
jgi:hypothetical protein